MGHPPFWMICSSKGKKKMSIVLIMKRVESEREKITKALRELKVTSPSDRYDLEYSSSFELSQLTGITCSFPGTHYWYQSPVFEMLPKLLRKLWSNTPSVLDVGAGNGELVKRIREISVRVSNDVADVHHTTHPYVDAVDISKKACQRITETGIKAFQSLGATPDYGKYEVIFLSYFVDRDKDQRSTFLKTSELIEQNGVVVLEGCFPCNFTSPQGFFNGTANVTKGRNAEEDISLVIVELAQLGLTLQERSDGERYVYSMDGPEVLPSTILVFRKK